MNFHYTKEQLVNAIRNLGVVEGDILFSHSNVGFLGLPEGCKTSDDVSELIYSAIKEVIGKAGTLVVPTFTYSFQKGEVFDIDETPSDCGIFTEYVRNLTNSIRSNDPSVSVVAIGGKSRLLTESISENSYDNESFFSRFFQNEGKVFNINFDAGSTFIHYVERELKVPYRYDKTFQGISIINGNKQKTSSTIWVRGFSSEMTQADFSPFSDEALAAGVYRTENVGRGSIGIISAANTYSLIKKILQHRPLLLTKAESYRIASNLTNKK